MKKTLIYSLALLVGASFASSCSDDKDELLSLPEKVYTGEQLDLTFSGAPMEGKSVKYVQNGSAATLTLYSDFDLSLIPDAGLTQTVKGPGILPGTPEQTLTVDLTPDGNHMNFTGNAETSYCSYTYTGSVKGDNLKLEISDVKLKDDAIAGNWMPRVETEEDDWGDPVLSVSPLRLKWSTDNDEEYGIEIMPNWKMSMQTILDLVGALPVIPDPSDEEAKISLLDGLMRTLKEVEFRDDSNIVAKYVEGGLTDGATVTSPLNMAHYVLNGAGSMSLFLNPQAIMKAELEKAAQTKAISSDNLISIAELLMSRVTPMLANGVPLKYDLQGDNLSVYVPTELILPILKETVLPVLQDEETVASIVEMLKNNPETAIYAEIAKSALASIPAIIEHTTTIEVGLNLTKVK